VCSTICIGFAAGIGFFGIAAEMTMFFRFANLMWHLHHGVIPVEQVKQERKLTMLEYSGE